MSCLHSLPGVRRDRRHEEKMAKDFVHMFKRASLFSLSNSFRSNLSLFNSSLLNLFRFKLSWLRPALFSPVRMAALGLAAGAWMLLSGCGSSSSGANIQVGPIAFTDANGVPQKTAPVSLTVGQGTYVAVTLTDDPQLLGANWNVYCGSALPPGTPLPPGQPQDESCGTFTPGHTISGPIPSYVTSGAGYVALYTAPADPPKNGSVTLYASSTTNPSKFTSVSLAINGLPVSIGFAPAPPAVMQTGASAQFRVVLNNDATNAGANWSVVCGASDCGSFSPAQTASGINTVYTAPATVPDGGYVQVTATSAADPTKAVSAKITID